MFKEEELEKIRRLERRWRTGPLKSARGRNAERKGYFRTTSGSEVKPVYSPLDVGEMDYERDLGFPGSYPFTRGVHSTMYRDRLWTFRQYAGHGTPEEANRDYKFLLESGQTGLSVPFDLPTQMGYDSDHPLAAGEVGKVGVAVNSLYDIEALFEGIPLDRVSVSLTINAPANLLLAMYIAVAEQRGIPPAVLVGTVQNDILKEYIARGTYIFPPGPSLAMAIDTIAYCTRHLPRWNSISVSGYHMREAGCTAAQEIGFSIANAIAYVEAAIAKGLAVDDFAPRISWFFNTHSNFFEEVAKFRALRRIWAQIMCERFGAANPRSWLLRTHIQTGSTTLTAEQLQNNIARTAIQGLAAVLGGVQSLALSCYDEAVRLPHEEPVHLALRTQQIIAFETGVTDTVDPLAGSYYVEWLTNELEERAMACIHRIDQIGGAVAAVEAGHIQREIANAAYDYQLEVESGLRVVVGVNRFQEAAHPQRPTFRGDPRVAEIQRAKLVTLRATRHAAAVQATLSQLEDAARRGKELIPPLTAAVKAYATVGEICDTLRRVYGEHRPEAFL